MVRDYIRDDDGVRRDKGKGRVEEARMFLDEEAEGPSKRRRSSVRIVDSEEEEDDDDDNDDESGVEEEEEEDESDVEEEEEEEDSDASYVDKEVDEEDRTLVERQGEMDSDDDAEESQNETSDEYDDDDDDDEEERERERGRRRKDESDDDEESEEESDDEYSRSRSSKSRSKTKAKPKPGAKSKRKRDDDGAAGDERWYHGERSKHNADDSIRRKANRVDVYEGQSLAHWRELAEEEREMIVARGGLIWQAARPLLAAMENDERTRAGVMLKSLMKSLNEKLQKVLVPGTRPMPRESKGSAKTLDQLNIKFHPMLSSLMSWSLETGGEIKADEEQERTSSRGDKKTLKASLDDELKGYALDNAVLEALLLPEVNDLFSLGQASDHQDAELIKAKQELNRLRNIHAEVERTADRADERLQTILEPTIEKLRNTKRAKVLSATHDVALRDSAQQALDKAA